MKPNMRPWCCNIFARKANSIGYLSNSQAHRQLHPDVVLYKCECTTYSWYRLCIQCMNGVDYFIIGLCCLLQCGLLFELSHLFKLTKMMQYKRVAYWWVQGSVLSVLNHPKNILEGGNKCCGAGGGGWSGVVGGGLIKQQQGITDNCYLSQTYALCERWENPPRMTFQK